MTEVLISGAALAIILSSEQILDSLVPLLIKSDTIIIFRSSPLQKAQVVKLIRKYDPKKLTLAIGDGYNDVNMLQTAQVGIGIQGKESSAAAAFSDFSIPIFKDLRRLMFWHGRSYGYKVHYMIFFEFFKQVLRSPMTLFINAHNGWSGVESVDGVMMSLYNVCMTTLYLAWWTAGDYDIDQSKYKYSEQGLCFKMAELYSLHRKEMSEFIKRQFIVMGWCYVVGLVHFYNYYFLEGYYGARDDEGRAIGADYLGIHSTVWAVFVFHAGIAFVTHNWDWMMIVFFIASFQFVWLASYFNDNAIATRNYGSIFNGMYDSLTFWLHMIMSCSIVLFPMLAYFRWR